VATAAHTGTSLRRLEHVLGDAVRAGVSVASVARALGIPPRSLRDLMASDAALHDAVAAARAERQDAETRLLEELRRRLAG
jgi:hypothetical protein